MADNLLLSENDPDLILAKQYGKMLDVGEEVSLSQDPFMEMLFKIREVENQTERTIPVRGLETSWEMIQQSTSPSAKKHSSTFFSLSLQTKWYWAAAAVLIIAFSSFFIFQQTISTSPRLIAESGSSISEVVLTDGSLVTLRPNSKLFEVSVSSSEHLYELSGEGLFNVDSSLDRTFIVEAGSGRVVVTGTEFNLNTIAGNSNLYLIEGEVLFENSDGNQSTRLTAGEAATVTFNNQLLSVYSFEPDEITGWIRNRLTFRDREAESIFDELEFHFNITIDAPEQIKQERLGGSIALQNAQQSLQDLGIVLGGEFIQTDDTIYQFRSE